MTKILLMIFSKACLNYYCQNLFRQHLIGKSAFFHCSLVDHQIVFFKLYKKIHCTKIVDFEM